MAILIKGRVKGIKVKERVDTETGEVKRSYFVGISEMVDDDYDQRERVTDIRISDRLAKTGLQAIYEKLKGQEVLAPIFCSGNHFKGKVYLNYFFSDDGMPVPVQKKVERVA